MLVADPAIPRHPRAANPAMPHPACDGRTHGLKAGIQVFRARTATALALLVDLVPDSAWASG
eukprot:SAG31_NODE_32_length_32319_cov_28.042681_9_plen_62_part_00